MMTRTCACIFLSGLLYAASAQQPQTNQQPQQAPQPNIAGQVNGQFTEPKPLDFNDHTGFTSMFDGKTLNGWDGRPGVWSVQDGNIVGESSKEKPAGNTFLVYQPLQARDFDLKLEIKVERGGGSGIQYRSSLGIPAGRTAGKGEPPLDPRWVMVGPQADFWFPLDEKRKAYNGQLYSQNTSRGIIAWRGQVVQSLAGKPPQLVGNIGERTAPGHRRKGWRLE